MTYLAIDTSTPYLTLALGQDQALHAFHQEVGQKHAELLLPTLKQLLAESQLELKALQGIIVTQGPGSFTGVRIGCATAQGLAYASQLPIISIPTLDVVAHQALGQKVLVAMDARMGEVYYATYNEKGERLSPIQVGKPESVHLEGTGWAGIGNGFAVYPALKANLADAITQLDDTAKVTPDSLLALANTQRYPAHAAHETEILYVRNKVALTAKEQKAKHA